MALRLVAPDRRLGHAEWYTIRIEQSRRAEAVLSKRGETMQADALAVLRRRRGPLSAHDVLGEMRVSHTGIAPPPDLAGPRRTDGPQAHPPPRLVERRHRLPARPARAGLDPADLRRVRDGGRGRRPRHARRALTHRGQIRRPARAPCDRDPRALRVLRGRTGAGMTAWQPMLRLLLPGAARRLAGAAAVVVLLWLGVFWATSTPGPHDRGAHVSRSDARL